MNEPWECPRCGTINAPFNPSCFCKKENKSSLEQIFNNPEAQMQDTSKNFNLIGYNQNYAQYLKSELEK